MQLCFFLKKVVQPVTPVLVPRLSSPPPLSHFPRYLGCRETPGSSRRVQVLARVPWGFGAAQGLEIAAISYVFNAMFALGEPGSLGC